MKISSRISVIFIFLLVAFLFQSCDENNVFNLNFDNAPPPFDTSQAVRDTTIAGNIDIFILEEGEGPFEVVSRDIIQIEFTARNEAGEIFDSSFNNRSTTTSTLEPNLLPTQIQRQECITPNNPQGICPTLIEGFRKGLVGMKVGESRTIIVPSDMGYNDSQLGTNGFDLRDQVLTYDVELLNIR